MRTRRLRVLLKGWLARRWLVIEFCHDCGREQPLVWTAPDELWASVMQRTDSGGVVCPQCFDKRARARGSLIRWVPIQEVMGG